MTDVGHATPVSKGAVHGKLNLAKLVELRRRSRIDRARQLATDFAVWDRGQQTKCIQWHLRFVNIVADILSKVEAGREVAVATWWEQQVADMAPARLVLPALPAPAGK